MHLYNFLADMNCSFIVSEKLSFSVKFMFTYAEFNGALTD